MSKSSQETKEEIQKEPIANIAYQKMNFKKKRKIKIENDSEEALQIIALMPEQTSLSNLSWFRQDLQNHSRWSKSGASFLKQAVPKSMRELLNLYARRDVETLLDPKSKKEITKWAFLFLPLILSIAATINTWIFIFNNKFPTFILGKLGPGSSPEEANRIADGVAALETVVTIVLICLFVSKRKGLREAITSRNYTVFEKYIEEMIKIRPQYLTWSPCQQSYYHACVIDKLTDYCNEAARLKDKKLIGHIYRAIGQVLYGFYSDLIRVKASKQNPRLEKYSVFVDMENNDASSLIRNISNEEGFYFYFNQSGSLCLLVCYGNHSEILDSFPFNKADMTVIQRAICAPLSGVHVLEEGLESQLKREIGQQLGDGCYRLYSYWVEESLPDLGWVPNSNSNLKQKQLNPFVSNNPGLYFYKDAQGKIKVRFQNGAGFKSVEAQLCIKGLKNATKVSGLDGSHQDQQDNPHVISITSELFNKLNKTIQISHDLNGLSVSETSHVQAHSDAPSSITLDSNVSENVRKLIIPLLHCTEEKKERAVKALTEKVSQVIGNQADISILPRDEVEKWFRVLEVISSRSMYLYLDESADERDELKQRGKLLFVPLLEQLARDPGQNIHFHLDATSRSSVIPHFQIEPMKEEEVIDMTSNTNIMLPATLIAAVGQLDVVNVGRIVMMLLNFEEYIFSSESKKNQAYLVQIFKQWADQEVNKKSTQLVHFFEYLCEQCGQEIIESKEKYKKIFEKLLIAFGDEAINIVPALPRVLQDVLLTFPRIFTIGWEMDDMPEELIKVAKLIFHRHLGMNLKVKVNVITKLFESFFLEFEGSGEEKEIGRDDSVIVPLFDSKSENEEDGEESDQLEQLEDDVFYSGKSIDELRSSYLDMLLLLLTPKQLTEVANLFSSTYQFRGGFFSISSIDQIYDALWAGSKKISHLKKSGCDHYTQRIKGIVLLNMACHIGLGSPDKSAFQGIQTFILKNKNDFLSAFLDKNNVFRALFKQVNLLLNKSSGDVVSYHVENDVESFLSGLGFVLSCILNCAHKDDVKIGLKNKNQSDENLFFILSNVLIGAKSLSFLESSDEVRIGFILGLINFSLNKYQKYNMGLHAALKRGLKRLSQVVKNDEDGGSYSDEDERYYTKPKKGSSTKPLSSPLSYRHVHDHEIKALWLSLSAFLNKNDKSNLNKANNLSQKNELELLGLNVNVSDEYLFCLVMSLSDLVPFPRINASTNEKEIPDAEPFLKVINLDFYMWVSRLYRIFVLEKKFRMEHVICILINKLLNSAEEINFFSEGNEERQDLPVTLQDYFGVLFGSSAIIGSDFLNKIANLFYEIESAKHKSTSKVDHSERLPENSGNDKRDDKKNKPCLQEVYSRCFEGLYSKDIFSFIVHFVEITDYLSENLDKDKGVDKNRGGYPNNFGSIICAYANLIFCFKVFDVSSLNVMTREKKEAALFTINQYLKTAVSLYLKCVETSDDNENNRDNKRLLSLLNKELFRTLFSEEAARFFCCERVSVVSGIKVELLLNVADQCFRALKDSFGVDEIKKNILLLKIVERLKPCDADFSMKKGIHNQASFFPRKQIDLELKAALDKYAQLLESSIIQNQKNASMMTKSNTQEVQDLSVLESNTNPAPQIILALQNIGFECTDDHSTLLKDWGNTFSATCVVLSSDVDLESSL